MLIVFVSMQLARRRSAPSMPNRKLKEATVSPYCTLYRTQPAGGPQEGSDVGVVEFVGRTIGSGVGESRPAGLRVGVGVS